VLIPAIVVKDEVLEKLRSTWFVDDYKYYHCANYFEDFEICNSTWVNHQFASVRDGKVIGYIGYSIDRSSGDVAYALNIVNFEKKPSVTFSVDLGNALKDIFEKYCFRKLRFSVIVGNPIEKSYDKMCKKYGGSIVGIEKQNIRLIDGKFYDEKLYSILRSDYMKAIGKEV